MQLGHDRLKYLFQRYMHDQSSENELAELFDYIRESEEDVVLKSQIIEVFRQTEASEDHVEVDWETMFAKVTGKNEVTRERVLSHRRNVKLWWKIAAAVLLLIAGSSVVYFYGHKVSPPSMASHGSYKGIDVLPGGNKARLTLSNGATLMLDSAHTGKLASLGNINIMKVTNGKLAYKQSVVSGQRAMGRKLKYNTLTTPRGGQYQLTLSDGTKVWLNAASSIHFPVAFSGRNRKVEVTGEAYFEIAPNASMPFIVQEGKMKILVLGTHFNINTYKDEPHIKVTLLSGSIKVKMDDGRSALLSPGEQAVLHSGLGGDDKQITVVKNVDVGDVVAWKNGFFSFDNDNLSEVMRKFSRWYDVDVTYEKGVRNDQHFSGRIDRNLTLSQVLNGLQEVNAHFRIEAGRKVKILP